MCLVVYPSKCSEQSEFVTRSSVVSLYSSRSFNAVGPVIQEVILTRDMLFTMMQYRAVRQSLMILCY